MDTQPKIDQTFIPILSTLDTVSYMDSKEDLCSEVIIQHYGVLLREIRETRRLEEEKTLKEIILEGISLLKMGNFIIYKHQEDLYNTRIRIGDKGKKALERKTLLLSELTNDQDYIQYTPRQYIHNQLDCFNVESYRKPPDFQNSFCHLISEFTAAETWKYTLQGEIGRYLNEPIYFRNADEWCVIDDGITLLELIETLNGHSPWSRNVQVYSNEKFVIIPFDIYELALKKSQTASVFNGEDLWDALEELNENWIDNARCRTCYATFYRDESFEFDEDDGYFGLYAFLIKDFSMSQTKFSFQIPNWDCELAPIFYWRRSNRDKLFSLGQLFENYSHFFLADDFCDPEQFRLDNLSIHSAYSAKRVVEKENGIALVYKRDGDLISSIIDFNNESLLDDIPNDLIYCHVRDWECQTLLYLTFIDKGDPGKCLSNIYLISKGTWLLNKTSLSGRFMQDLFVPWSTKHHVYFFKTSIGYGSTEVLPCSGKVYIRDYEYILAQSRGLISAFEPDEYFNGVGRFKFEDEDYWPKFDEYPNSKVKFVLSHSYFEDKPVDFELELLRADCEAISDKMKQEWADDRSQMDYTGDNEISKSFYKDMDETDPDWRWNID